MTERGNKVECTFISRWFSSQSTPNLLPLRWEHRNSFCSYNTHQQIRQELSHTLPVHLAGKQPPNMPLLPSWRPHLYLSKYTAVHCGRTTQSFPHSFSCCYCVHVFFTWSLQSLTLKHVFSSVAFLAINSCSGILSLSASWTVNFVFRKEKKNRFGLRFKTGSVKLSYMEPFAYKSVSLNVLALHGKQYKCIEHYSHVAGKQSNSSVCQQGELMVSPWISHVRQTEQQVFFSSSSQVPGLFFLEASNPGGPVAWRHAALLPSPLSADVLYPLSHFRCSVQTPITALVFRGSWRPSIWLKQAFSSGSQPKAWRREVPSECVGWCERGASHALLFSPPTLDVSYLAPWSSTCDQEAWLPSFSLPLALQKGNSPREGGGRWALLRCWLKITGIFKAAEESQGKQKLDSLPPGWSSPCFSLFPPSFLPLLFKPPLSYKTS